MTDNGLDPNEPRDPGQWIPTPLRRLWADGVLALVFLTRLPAPGPVGDRPLHGAGWAFPLVGVLVALIAGFSALVLAGWAGPFAVGLVTVAAALLVTGALHEDGLADTADGLGGGRTREAKLAIMRDSHIGTYGVLALVLAVGLKAALIAQLFDVGWGPMMTGLIAAAAVSRGALVVTLSVLPPARSDGAAARAGRPGFGVMLAAVAISITIGWLCMGSGQAMLRALGGTIVLGGAVVTLAQRQIGGHTGDVLGAVQVVSELAVLLAWAHPR